MLQMVLFSFNTIVHNCKPPSWFEDFHTFYRRLVKQANVQLGIMKAAITDLSFLIYKLHYFPSVQLRLPSNIYGGMVQNLNVFGPMSINCYALYCKGIRKNIYEPLNLWVETCTKHPRKFDTFILTAAKPTLAKVWQYTQPTIAQVKNEIIWYPSKEKNGSHTRRLNEKFL